MLARIFFLAPLVTVLLAIDPSWIVIDWAAPIDWIAGARPEDAAAGLVRLTAIALASSQLLALVALTTARAVGNGAVERATRRVLLPVLRTAAPIALAAGSALPAAASETRLPVALPLFIVQEADPAPPQSVVVVEPGDSMWTIAAAHTTGEVAPYWRLVVDLNRDRFRDVDLIHPGDEVLLP